MTIGAAYIVAPVFTSTEVVAFFFPRMACKAFFRNRFGGFVFERNDLCGVAVFSVRFTWTMASFAAGHFIFPTADIYELRVRRVRKGFELVLVAILTGVATYIV